MEIKFYGAFVNLYAIDVMPLDTGAHGDVLGRRAEGDLGAEPERARRRGAAAGADLRAAGAPRFAMRGDLACFR